MCGILGEFSFNMKNKSCEKHFKDILNLSINRGPNNSKIILGDNFQLGFNRLSIIDLSNNANQPMSSLDKRHHMVFNGEVYNFKNLAKKYHLQDLKSTSDSEVVIRLIKLGVEVQLSLMHVCTRLLTKVK